MLVYLTISAGSQYTTVNEFKYPYILLNHASKTNRRPKSAKLLFVDCGGFYNSLAGNYKTSDTEYLEYVKSVNADFFALRDYTCEKEVCKRLKTTTKEQIKKTFEHHLRMLEYLDDFLLDCNGKKAIAVPVLQGYELEDYLYCLDLYREAGLINSYMAIGTLCRRNATREITKIVGKLREELPDWVMIHAFGVKIPTLKRIWNLCDSIDTGAWDFVSRWNIMRKEKTKREASREALKSFIHELDKIRCSNQKVLWTSESLR